jgi:hypothetical protein
MSHTNRLAKIAKAKGLTIKALIDQALAENGGSDYRAAVALGVYPNAIRYHRTGKAVQKQAK